MLISLACCVPLAWPGAAPGTPVVWTGVTDDDWFEPSNWSTLTVPGSGDAVELPAVATSPRIPTGTASFASLTIGAGGSLEIDGPADLNVIGSVLSENGSSATVAGDLTVGDALTFGDATAVWTQTGGEIEVFGDWNSGGGGLASGAAGLVRFTGDGLIAAGGGALALPDVEVVSGVRSVVESNATSEQLLVEIAGDLSVLGGSLSIRTWVTSFSLTESATLRVAGDFLLDATATPSSPAQLTLVQASSVDPGDRQILEVAGAFTAIGDGSISMSNEGRIECAGGLFAAAPFIDSSGQLTLDGSGAVALGTVNRAPTLDLPLSTTISGGDWTAANSLAMVCPDLQLAAGALLSAGSSTLDLGAVTATVAGGLAVEAGGELLLAPTHQWTLDRLELDGTGAAPARIAGSGGLAGYSLTAAGILRGTVFELLDLGGNGLTIESTAVIAPAPGNLRGGLLQRGAGTGPGVLLQLGNALPLELRYLSFEDASGVALGNVSTTSGVPVTLVNSSGSYAGEGLDLDPGDVIEWIDVGQTIVESFDAVPGPANVTLAWTTSDPVDTAEFLVQRRVLGDPLFATIATVVPDPSKSYFINDGSVVADVTYEYQILDRLTHGVELETGPPISVTPYSSELPEFVATVGAGGEFADLQAAIDATPTGSVRRILLVESGSYAAFTRGPGFDGDLYVVPDGSGPVQIDASAAPIVIEGSSFDEGTQLTGCDITAAAGSAILVIDCAGAVVIGESQITTTGPAPAIRVENSTGVLVQRTDVAATLALRIESGSIAAAGASSLPGSEVYGTSHLTTREIAGSPSVDPGGTLVAISGPLPDISVDTVQTIGVPFAADLTGPPDGVVLWRASRGLAYLDPFAPNWEMPLLLDSTMQTQLRMELLDSVTGEGTIDLLLPPSSPFLGQPFSVQFVAVNLSGSMALQFSNVALVIGVPAELK